MSLDNIKNMIAAGNHKAALEELGNILAASPDNDEALFMRGKLRWRAGDRAGAASDYARAASVNPDSPAVAALEMARSINDFFNPDMFNP